MCGTARATAYHDSFGTGKPCVIHAQHEIANVSMCARTHTHSLKSENNEQKLYIDNDKLIFRIVFAYILTFIITMVFGEIMMWTRAGGHHCLHPKSLLLLNYNNERIINGNNNNDNHFTRATKKELATLLAQVQKCTIGEKRWGSGEGGGRNKKGAAVATNSDNCMQW